MSTNKTNSENATRKKISPKQIAAIIAIVLLVSLYLVTLFVAIFNKDASGHLFAACLYASVAIPLLTWAFIWIYGRTTGSRVVGDPKEVPSPTDEEP